MGEVVIPLTVSREFRKIEAGESGKRLKFQEI